MKARGRATAFAPGGSWRISKAHSIVLVDSAAAAGGRGRRPVRCWWTGAGWRVVGACGGGGGPCQPRRAQPEADARMLRCRAEPCGWMSGDWIKRAHATAVGWALWHAGALAGGRAGMMVRGQALEVHCWASGRVGRASDWAQRQTDTTGWGGSRRRRAASAAARAWCGRAHGAARVLYRRGRGGRARRFDQARALGAGQACPPRARLCQSIAQTGSRQGPPQMFCQAAAGGGGPLGVRRGAGVQGAQQAPRARRPVWRAGVWRAGPSMALKGPLRCLTGCGQR